MKLKTALLGGVSIAAWAVLLYWGSLVSAQRAEDRESALQALTFDLGSDTIDPDSSELFSMGWAKLKEVDGREMRWATAPVSEFVFYLDRVVGEQYRLTVEPAAVADEQVVQVEVNGVVAGELSIKPPTKGKGFWIKRRFSVKVDRSMFEENALNRVRFVSRRPEPGARTFAIGRIRFRKID